MAPTPERRKTTCVRPRICNRLSSGSDTSRDRVAFPWRSPEIRQAAAGPSPDPGCIIHARLGAEEMHMPRPRSSNGRSFPPEAK